MIRPAILAGILLLALVPFTPSHAATTGAPVITDTPEAVKVHTSLYDAVVDKPMGNLKAVYQNGTHRVLGADTGIVQGASLFWNDTTGANHAQSDWKAESPATVTFHDQVVVVDHAAFREEYTFAADRIEVVVDVKATALMRTNDVHLFFGSEVIPPNRQINNAALPTYGELHLKDYTTDFMSDQSTGVSSLVSFQSRDANVPRFESINVAGASTWYRSTGHVWIGAGTKEKVAPSLPIALKHWEGGRFMNNKGFPAGPKNPAADDVIIVHAADGYQNGDRIHQVLRFDDRSYVVKPLVYPVRTDNETNHGLDTGRIVVPNYAAPPGGYRMLIGNHGNTGNAYDNTFMWDFLATEGYVVAATNYTSNAGQGFKDNDFGYNQQTEIEDLRQFVLAHYPIDRDRQYVAGLSLGGLNTFLAAINHPDEYAAAVPQSPVYNGTYIVKILNPSVNTDSYAFRAGNPKYRTDQLTIPTMIVCGTNDLDAALLPNSVEAKNDHPSIDLRIVPNSGHELWTWEAYRKEIRKFLDDHPRANNAPRLVGRFPGAVTGQVPGFRDNGLQLYAENQVVRIGPLPNDTFTRVDATSVHGNGATVKVDRPVRVRYALPSLDADLNPTVKDQDNRSVAFTYETGWAETYRPARFVAFDGVPGNAYTVYHDDVAHAATAPVKGRTAGPGPLMALVASVLGLVLAAAARRR